MKKIYNRNWLFNLKSAMMVTAILFAGTAMAQLSGTYTINSGAATAGTNFASFAAFESAINTNGVSGPVVVNVTTATYTDDLALTVSGTSTNTITINGNGATLTSSNSGGVINFNGCDYVSIDNLIIRNTRNSSGTRGVWVHNNADYNSVTNSEIIFTALTSTSNSNAYIMFSNSATGRSYGDHGGYNVFDNNYMHGSSSSYGPYYAVCDYRGTSYRNNAMGNEFTNNEIAHVYYYNFYFYYSNGMQVVGNDVHTNRSNANYVYDMYAYQCKTTSVQMKFNDNDFHDQSGLYCYGTYMYYTEGTSSLPLEVNRNTLRNKDADYYVYGFRISYANNSSLDENKIVDNTAGYYMYYGFYHRYCANASINQNIFARNQGDYGVFYAVYDSYNSNHSTSHNTVDIHYDPDYYFYMVWYVYYYNTPVNIVVNNNITSISGSPGFGYSYFLYAYYNADEIDFANNVWDVTTTGTRYWIANQVYHTNYAAWAAAAEDDTSVEEDPDFVNVAGDDFRPQNPAIANMGTPGIETLDWAGVTRTACGPDPGAFEFFVDHSASNLTFAPNATECSGYTSGIAIDITNGTGIVLAGAEAYWDLNGAVTTETVADIAASSTATHTFAAEPVFNAPGTNTLTVGLGCDDDASNNSASVTFTVIKSPGGGDFAQGATWEGYWEGGTTADPDVTVPGNTLEYDISAPSAVGYAMADYGTDWNISNVSTTSGGMTVGAAEGLVLTATTSGTTVTFDPDPSLTDSIVCIMLRYEDINTGCDTIITRCVYVPFTPDVDFIEQDICLGDVAQFKNTSTLGGTDYMLQTWEFDDPDNGVTDDNSDILDGFWNYSTYGTADVTLTSINGVYPLFEYSITKSVTITPKPEVDFKVLNACEGEEIDFQNSTTLPVTGTITYDWDFADGNTSTDENPTHIYATPGQRQVTLTATANGCDATLVKNAYQFETPTADFSSTGTCTYEEIMFANASTIENDANMGFTWDLNPGLSTINDPINVYTTEGTKSVTLTAVSEFGCTDMISKDITLLESPKADFSWDAACNLTPVNFQWTGTAPNSGANTSYVWDLDGTSAGGETPQKLFPSVGPKTITLTAADLNGCSSTITKEINVVLQAVADFEAGNACEGTEVVFTNKSAVAAGDLEYSWSFGSTDHSPTNTYPVTGLSRAVNVTLDAIVPGGCSDQITKTIQIYAAPDATFSADVQGRTVVVSANETTGSIYQWSFGDGSQAANVDNTVYTYENVDAGTFDICLAVKNAQCWSYECNTVSVDLAGVDELTENNDMITVYPNPTTGNFNLTIDNASDDVVIKVGNILGNEIPFELTDNLNGKYSVNLSGIADGVYFVQVKNGDFYATKKITVSK